MTDIWRSFIAQRCLWELGHGLVFHGPEVIQERNLLRCYEALVAIDLFPAQELELVRAWLGDLEGLVDGASRC